MAVEIHPAPLVVTEGIWVVLNHKGNYTGSTVRRIRR